MLNLFLEIIVEMADKFKGRVKEIHFIENYCGCLFGLTAQREAQKKIMDEMFNPQISQMLPESIEERDLNFIKEEMI